MKNSYLAITGLMATIGLGAPAVAEVDGVIALINESSASMCAVYVTTPEADFADSPELLLANDLGCIQPGEASSIWYEGLSDCYAVVEIFDGVGDPLYANGFELCTREYIIITDDDVFTGEDSDEPTDEVVVEEGRSHSGYLEIVNTSEQQLCLVYFEALENGSEQHIYPIGENGNCIDPNMVYFLEYSLPIDDCEVQVSIETGFLDVLYDQVYDLCQQTKIVVTN